MTLLSTLYASAPAAEVLIPTLAISHPAISAIRVCAGRPDLNETQADILYRKQGRTREGFQYYRFCVNALTAIPSDGSSDARSPHEMA